MKITKDLVKSFEIDQKQYGTAVALNNVIWQLADDLLKDLDIIKINTIYRRKNEKSK